MIWDGSGDVEALPRLYEGELADWLVFEQARREEEFSLGIVSFVTSQREVAVEDGVAVDAAMRSSVILANIARGVAAALCAVPPELNPAQQRSTGDAFQAFRIDAARLLGDAGRMQHVL